MKENSIEEDIKIIEKYLLHFKKVCSPEMLKKDEIIKVIQYKEIQALQHILTDYKRVLKENRELKNNTRKNEQNSLEFDVDGDWAELKRILNESRKTNEYITYKGEKWIKEKYCIPIQKLKDIIEKISLYKKLAKESIEQRIVIADGDSLEYGRMQAHSVDMSMLQELLKKLESEDK